MSHQYPVLPLLCGLLFSGAAAAQADQIMPITGGSGGGRFEARCANNEFLTGFELRTGDDVDAIRPICATAYAPEAIASRRPYPTSFGGTGGTVVQLLCPDHAPAISGVVIWKEGHDTVIVNTVGLYCSVATPNQPLTQYPAALFDGHTTTRVPNPVYTPNQCPAGLVPVGITGRSGIWLDAFGLICGRLQFVPSKFSEPAKAIGRISTQAAPSTTKHICDAARDARARNSPAAPNLEAQCRAAPPPAAPPPAAPTPPLAPVSAPAAITAADLQRVMARGLALSKSDPLAAELRRRVPDTARRRGFDLGMGIWAGNTAPGPGKTRYRDALLANEQPGFDIAEAFSLPRNKHAVLSQVGATIANADRTVAAARTAENDVYFWLGFDIATGIFGNPAAGAQGNRATGPGSLGIRNELNAAGQRGFDAATALHLARTYK